MRVEASSIEMISSTISRTDVEQERLRDQKPLQLPAAELGGYLFCTSPGLRLTGRALRFEASPPTRRRRGRGGAVRAGRDAVSRRRL